MELLCEKSIGTANRPMGAGEALRRVLECLASGIVMPDGSGIYDPCEKEATDAIGHLDTQQWGDITQSVQHALWLAAFGQLHKVLGMDPLPSKMPKKPKNKNLVDYTVDGSTFEASGPSKKTAKLHVAVKVVTGHGLANRR
uniref:DZF domain-containing protein n=1 Tax=Peromyscus maniculatus bairdii TaxID=230844 RepID=A0A8C8UDQ2_PERMB